MSPSSSPTPSLSDHVQPFDVGAYVTHVAFLGDVAAFALGDGRVRLQRPDQNFQDVVVHEGSSILVSTHDSHALYTGGEDGYIYATDTHGKTKLIGETGGKWVDALSVSHSGALAWSAAKDVSTRDAKGKINTWKAPSSVRGLAFSPKGYRLAVAHYDGASLWYPATSAPPELLHWKGAHLDVMWSKDARFVITTMQEHALHGWRLAPSTGHMRMTGYPSKVRSVSWSHDGKWLATSGAHAAIVWPFVSVEGPMGKAPNECGEHTAKVSAVAFHPHARVLAVGYEDGLVRLIRFDDSSHIHVHEPSTGCIITSLAWSSDGRYLAFGGSNGQAGVLTLP
jgi:WD40 repeat protein